MELLKSRHRRYRHHFHLLDRSARKRYRDVEILTTPLGDFIAYGDNASKCFGVVGSGNRNFNNQYCLTAKQYSQRYGFPVLADFEMRGMLGDIKKVAVIIADLYELETEK